MQAATSLISDLETAITSSGSDRRIETLRRVTDLFLSNADRYDPEQVQVFDDVLGRMIVHIEQRALAELSERLGPVDNAPLEVIRTLALNDAIEVAGPVIENSSRLSVSDLVSIASTKSQDHLLAISGRKQIDESVTDVLVERGNTAVVRKVAVNQGARLSSPGYVALVRRAENDDELTDSVGRRADLPPQLFQELLQKADGNSQGAIDCGPAGRCGWRVGRPSEGFRGAGKDKCCSRLLLGEAHGAADAPRRQAPRGGHHGVCARQTC